MDVIMFCLTKLEAAFEGNNSKDFNSMMVALRHELSFFSNKAQENVEVLQKELQKVKQATEDKNEKLTKLHLEKRTVEVENQALKYVLHVEGIQIHGVDKLNPDPENLEIKVEKQEINVTSKGQGRKELLTELENAKIKIQDCQDVIFVMSHDLEVCHKEITELKELLDVYQGTRKTMEKEIERLKAGSSDPNLTATILLLKQEKAKMQDNLNRAQLLYQKLEEDHVKLEEDNEKLKDLVARKELEASNLFRMLKEERNK